MNEQAIRFRFGIFVLASLILLAVLIILFGGFPNYFRQSTTYSILFKNAQGIAPGTPVRRSGVNIGDVRSVVLDDVTGDVRVLIRVDEKYPLRKGDKAAIAAGLIGGDSAITITPPEGADPVKLALLEPGGILKGTTPPEAGALLQKTADLVKPAQDALVEIRKVFRSLDKMTPKMDETLLAFREFAKTANEVSPDMKKTSEDIRSLSKTWTRLGDRVDGVIKTNEDKFAKSLDRADELLKRLNGLLSDENQKNFREALKNVRDSSTQFEAITKETNALVKESRVTVKDMQRTFKKIDVLLDDLQKSTSPFKEQAPGLIRNLNESATNLNRTLKDLRELMQVVARSDGTVQRLLTDPSLYNNLNDTAIMATKIMPRLDRVLCDVETFADKLARHPELIGLGGVIRPSSGLKASPSQHTPYRVYPLP